MALEPGRSRRGVPASSAIIGTALAVAAFMASVTFGANLVHLERTPQLYGKTWDVAMDLQFGVIGTSRVRQVRRGGARATAWTFGLQAPSVSASTAGGAGHRLAPGGVACCRRQSWRAARQRQAARVRYVDHAQRRRQAGQIVDVSASGPSQPLKVVGRAVFPYLGRLVHSDRSGQGALVPASMLAGTGASRPMASVTTCAASSPGDRARPRTSPPSRGR